VRGLAILEKINDDLKKAMKSGDKVAVNALRMLKSAVRKMEIDKEITASNEDVLDIILKEAKMRKDAIKQYKKGGREDLAEKEAMELKILEGYLPKPFNDEELEKIIRDTIEEVGASNIKAFSRVMSKVMEKVKGKADGSHVSRMVREMLSS